MEIVVVVAIAVVVAVVAIGVRHGRRPSKPALAPIRFTIHAQERMQLRGVSRAQIEAVVASPQRQQHDPEENSYRLERDFGSRVLKVWVAEPWPARDEIVVKSTAWKFHFELRIPASDVGRVVGAGGGNIRRLESQTQAKISVDRDGLVRITSGVEAHGLDAKKRIESMVSSPVARVGELWAGRVSKHLPHGVLVTSPQGARGLLSVAQLRPLVGGRRIDNIATVVPIGTAVRVRVEEVADGKIRLKLEA